MSKQIGWEGCIARLLVKEIVQPEVDSIVSIEDVISLGDEDDDDRQERVSEVFSVLFLAFVRAVAPLKFAFAS